MPKPLIISFTGASGTGKTSIVKELLKDPTYKLITSTTTRPARPSDLPGEYEYVTLERFKALRSQDQFLWAREYADNWYGTKISDLEKALKDPYISLLILIPEVVPILSSYAKAQHLPFYMQTPSQDILRERLKQRGDAQDVIEKRLATIAEWEQQVKTSGISYILLSNEKMLDDAVKLVRKKLELYC